MKNTLLLLFAIAPFTLHSMEQEDTQSTAYVFNFMWKHVILNEVAQKLNQYSDKQFILNQSEDYYTEYKKQNKYFNWAREIYMPNDCIFIKSSESPSIVTDGATEFLHFINVFKPLKGLVKEIKDVQSIACINKISATSLKTPIWSAKIALARFILFRTSYDSHIFNMTHFCKSNHFLLEPTHYAIATALGNFTVVAKNIPESISQKIELILIWTLRASKNTHNNLPNFTDEREPSMPTLLAKNDRINRFIISLFKGMLQPLKNKEYSFSLPSGRSKSGPNIDNTAYIEDTAQKMGIEIDIKYESFFFDDAFAPCIVKISEAKKSDNTCTIQ